MVRQGFLDPLAASKIMERHGPSALSPYVANAISQMHTIRAAAAAGHELFALFEDDLLAAGCPSLTNRKIADALEQLPSDADMLYLEACLESCERLAYSSRRPGLARAARPFCSGAIVFTKSGAARVAQACWPAWLGVDDMYEWLIMRGRLRAYLALPGLLFQDDFWQSNSGRNGANAFQVRCGRGQPLSPVSRAPRDE
jgi:hypothetical protein